MNLIVPNGFEANFTLGFSKGLAANGLHFLVLSCDLTAKRLRGAGINHVNVRGSLSADRPMSRKVFTLARYYARTLWLLLRHRNSTVHFTGILDDRRIVADAIVLLLFAKLTARRYIYTVHNVLPHGRRESSFYRTIYRFIYSIPDVLLVHTEGVRGQLMKEFGVSEKKVCLSSIGLNEEMPITNLASGDARSRLGFEAHEKLILFFGKIEEYKGPDMLVEAFEALPFEDAHLVMAGSFSDATFRERLLRQIASSRSAKRIRLYERFLDNAETEVFFKACDVLCLPYRNIYQSGLIFLAPRFGLPVIATDVGCLRDFLQDGFGTLTKTNDVQGICAALTEFFAHPPRVSRPEIIARSERLAWPNICKDLLPLYERSSAQVRQAYEVDRAAVA